MWPARIGSSAALVLAAAAACSDGSTQPDTTNQPADVRILQDDAQMLVGNERTLTVEIQNAEGTVLTGVTPVWTAASSTVVTVDSDGRVRAVGPGQSQVFATAGLGQDSVRIRVPDPAGNVANPGGVITTPDGVVRLEVPANALALDVKISIVAADPDSLPSGSAALDGTAFEFGPAGLQFTVPATLTIQYDPALTNPLEAARLRLHKLSGGVWTPVDGSTVDTDSTSVSGPLTSFSIYGVVAVPNTTPTASITSPAPGLVIASGLAITFTGTGIDAEEGSLTGESLSWTSSLDGTLGTGTTVVRSDLSIGDHLVTLTARDGEGAESTAEVSVTVVDGPPIVTILEPSADTVVKVGDAVTFRGNATDHVEGDIPGDSLVWTSSLDGSLGTGDSLTTSGLTLGDHLITLTASDSQGSTGVDSVMVSVKANEAPTVTITNPSAGASVGDRSGVTLQGSAEDPEDGALTGSALVWSSNLDGQLGTGTSVGSGALTIGTHVVTLTATDSEGAAGSATVSFTVFDEPPPLLTPVLAFVGEAGGTLTLSVTNSASYDPELFVLDGSLPACAGAPTPGRTWVEIYDGNGVFLDRFCDYSDRSDMASFSFTPATPPAMVYVKLRDRATGRQVRSGSVKPIPAVGTTIAGVVANDRDADLNTVDSGEALSGVKMQLIVDTNADGVIDAGEVTWATTTTDGSGAYSFTDLWQRNYIVRAVSPANATVLRALSASGDILDQTGTLLTTGTAGAGATLNQSGTIQVGTTDPPSQGDELPRWGYTLGTAAADTGLEPSGPGPNFLNGAPTTAPAHFVFLYKTGTISGTVKTGGAGVSGVLVTVTRCQTAASAPSPPAAGACTLKHGSPSPHITNVDTDSGGSFSVGGLLEGIYQIEVSPATGGYTTVDTPAGPSSYLAVIRGNGDSAKLADFIIS
jgi:Bacterial Ig-like domain (group 2)